MDDEYEKNLDMNEKIGENDRLILAIEDIWTAKFSA